jgi:endonuclease/exonuclease/phosphatase family metal-dependent hydrolase
MRIVTVNLFDGRVVPGELARFLDRFDPDVVCAQEVGHNAARILEARFPYGRVEPAFHWMGRAMVGRRPVEVASLDLSFRGGYVGATTMDDGADVEVIGLHLANPLDLVNGIPARRRQLAELEIALTLPRRRILVGDLNATPAWPAYRRLRRYLRDGVTDWAVRTGRRPPPTWGKRPGWPAVLRIDHVLTSGVEVVGLDVVSIAGLDHRALVADVETAR